MEGKGQNLSELEDPNWRVLLHDLAGVASLLFHHKMYHSPLAEDVQFLTLSKRVQRKEE